MAVAPEGDEAPERDEAPETDADAERGDDAAAGDRFQNKPTLDHPRFAMVCSNRSMMDSTVKPSASAL